MKIANNYLVSVIIPVYNSEKYVSKTIESVLAQSHLNIEIIVVDDGSIDNTAYIVKTYLRDGVDKYLYQSNKGVLKLSETLNKGLSLCKGELVTMLPSDDLWPQYRLERQVNYFLDPEVVMVHGKMQLIDENGNFLKNIKEPPKNFHARTNHPVGSILPFLFVSNFISQPTCLIRKSTLLKIGGYVQPPGNYAEDYPTHMHLSLHGKIIYLDDCIYAYYRQHGSQMTKNHFPEMVKTDNDFIFSFSRALDDDLRSKYNITNDFIDSTIKRKLDIIFYMEGKRLLFQNKRKLAYKYLLLAIVKCNFRLKIFSILLIMLSILTIDERLFYKLYNFSR